MTIRTLQQYYNEIWMLQQHSIYNVLTGHCKVLQYFRNLSNSFKNILAILQHFNGIFLKYFLNITVLCRLQLRDHKRLDDKNSERQIKYYNPHSTVILSEYFKNIPLKSCNIARIFIKLLERFLKYCRNLAMSAQNIINVTLLQYWYFIWILL